VYGGGLFAVGACVHTAADEKHRQSSPLATSSRRQRLLLLVEMLMMIYCTSAQSTTLRCYKRPHSSTRVLITERTANLLWETSNLAPFSVSVCRGLTATCCHPSLVQQ